MKLSPKQQKFVREYLIDMNGTQAAIRAGYSPRTAKQQGGRLLTKADVQQALKQAMKEQEKRTEISADRVVQELLKIAYADLKDFVEFGPGGVRVKDSQDVDGTMLAEVSETESKIGRRRQVKLHDKMKALELLGRHFGMFIDKKEITGKDGEPLSIVFVTSDEDD